MRLKEVSKRMNYDSDSKIVDKKVKLSKLIPKTPKDWDRKERREKLSFLTWLFLASFVFLLVSIGIAIFVQVFGVDRSVSSEKISILIQGQEIVEQEQLNSFVVNVVNRNPVKMSVANLIVSFPRGVFIEDLSEGKKYIASNTYSLGEIEANSSKNIPIKVFFFGEENSRKTMDIDLEYKTEGSVSLFRKATSHSVLLRQPPIQVSEPVINNQVSGKNSTITIDVVSNSVNSYNSIFVRALYPDNFIVKSTFPETLRGTNNEWQIVNLQPGGKTKISINGVIVGGNQLEQAVKFEGYISPTGGSDVALVSSSSTSFFIEKPFVDVELVFPKGLVVGRGEKLTGYINWSVAKDFSYEDVSFYLFFGGSGLDESKIYAQSGFYDGDRKQLLFDQNTDEKLSILFPSDEGSFEFEFGSLPNIEDFVFSQQDIKLSVAATGYESGSGARETLEELDNKTIKIRNSYLVDIKSVRNNLIQNTGPVPPTVGSETTYSILFDLENNGNDLENVLIEIPLTKDVRFTNQVGGNRTKGLSYDEESHQVVLDLGRVSGFGVNKKIEVEFQVLLKPTIANRGDIIYLTKESKFVAKDSFIDESYQTELRPVSTDASDLDSLNSGKVQ